MGFFLSGLSGKQHFIRTRISRYQTHHTQETKMMSQKKPKGPVFILGGGISGIQAALSIAEAGYGVYLLERTTSLGGMLPNLHRIYPLCNCCKVNPKIAACEQHPNIRVLLNATLEGIQGKAGDFTISVLRDGKNEKLAAGAVVLAAGIETFDPSSLDLYGYGKLPNVLTSVEYEQSQKPTGPLGGAIQRPSDGKTPKKIAWLQCVGSRDINRCDVSYCSSVCCMYALKEAVTTKDVDEDIETTIFYMDMRTHGKGFEEYLNQAVERDVHLVRSRVHTIDPVVGTDDLLITYRDGDEDLQEEVFDMVVLSVGLRPSREAIETAKKIGINLSADQFVGTETFQPVNTNLPGIFVCGGLTGPLDIGQSITQATAALAEIGSVLEAEPFSPPREYPAPTQNTEAPKAALVYHLCPGMTGNLGVEIETYAKQLPGIVATETVEGDILTSLADILRKTGANRVVFASCSPVIHKSLIEEALKLSGLNPYLYETVDLRVLDPEFPGTQLKDRLRMGAARAMLLSPSSMKSVPVSKSALVVGAGISGMESALSLSRKGYPVHLVEKAKELGGHGRHVKSTWNGFDVQKYLGELIASVEQDTQITVWKETTVKRSQGSAGSFQTILDHAGKQTPVSHGATILSAGADPVKPGEYLYGTNPNVYLWSELNGKLVDTPSFFEKTGAAVFIQCVGSRDSVRPYCSNFCCSSAVRMALDIKAVNPDMDLYILYREMRTFGEREDIYREAREKGIIFIRYDLENKPQVERSDKGDGVRVTVFEPVLERPVAIEADFVSLQSAITAEGNEELASLFNVKLDSNGFIAESPEKMRPMDTSVEGIFMAGLAAYPKDLGETITQGKAAAARAMEILQKDTIQVGGLVAEVMTDKCAVCCTCVRTCPFNVPYINRETGAAFIDPSLCRGCGMCVAECPGKAIVMFTCSDQMLTEAPSVLLGN